MTKSLAVWLGCGWLALAQVPDPVREAVERGLAAEESGKDLAGATKAYMDAVAAADARRATHATALFRLAEVQRRQGRTNEATELYRRLLVEFPEQTEMVAVARRHAGAETAAASVSPARPTVGPANDAERLLEDEIRVAEQQLLSEQRKFEAGRAGDDEVLKARRELLGLKRQLAEKRQRRDVLDVLPTAGSSKVEMSAPPTAAMLTEDRDLSRLKGLFLNSPDLLNQSGPEGTPLEKAVWQGHTRVLAYLLGEGMPTRSEESLRAGLKAASQSGRLDVCRMLLDAGADPNRVDSGGGLPLLRAAYAGHRAVVELLLDRGAKVDGSLERDTQEIVPGTRFRKGANALFMAVYGKRMAVLDLLLQRGCDANGADGSGVTPLASAIVRNWQDGALRLLEAGADPDLGYALHCACSSMPSLIRPLLEAGADPNRMPEKRWMRDQANGDTWQEPWSAPLHLASGTEQVQGIAALLDAGAFVNAGDGEGRTPLDVASTDEVRALLRARGGRSTELPRAPGDVLSAIVVGALAAQVPGVDPGVPRSPGQTQQQQPPPLRMFQFLQQIVLVETNSAALAPDLSRVVVTRQVPSNLPSAPSVGGASISPNIRGYRMVRDPATGQKVMHVDGDSVETVTTNDVAAILASGDASKEIEIPVDGFTRIHVPFKPRPKVERPVRKPASVVAPMGAGLVTVLGAVQRPGNIELVPGKPMDLVQVIAASGGLGRTADRKRIVLRRGAETKGVDLDTAMSERVPVEPGDIIEVANVGSVPTVVVFDAMEGEFPVPDGQPLMLSTIMRKLPPNSFANRRKVEIQRVGPDGKPMPTIQVNVDDVLMNNNRSADVELKAGDRIRVPRKVIHGF
jgi:ankyrin repeat protein